MFKLFFIEEKFSTFEKYRDLLSRFGDVDYFCGVDEFLGRETREHYTFGIVNFDLSDQNYHERAKRLIDAKVRDFCFFGSDDMQESKERALSMGALDYLWDDMPYSEMSLRVQNAFRLVKESTPLLYSSSLKFNRFLQCAYIQDQNLDLTQREFHILNALIRSYPSCLTKDALIELLWEGVSVSPQTLNTHLMNLRKKIAGWEYCIEFKRSSGFGLTKKS